RTTLKDGLRTPPLRQARTGQPAPPPAAATLLLRRKRYFVVALAFFAAAAGLHDPRWRRRRSEPTAQRDRLPLLQHERASTHSHAQPTQKPFRFSLIYLLFF